MVCMGFPSSIGTCDQLAWVTCHEGMEGYFTKVLIRSEGIGLLVVGQWHALMGALMGTMPAGSVLNSATSVYTKRMLDSKSITKTKRMKKAVGTNTPDRRGGGG